MHFKCSKTKLGTFFLALMMILHTFFLLSLHTYAAEHSTEASSDSYSEVNGVNKNDLDRKMTSDKSIDSSEKAEVSTEPAKDAKKNNEEAPKQDDPAEEKTAEQLPKTKNSGISTMASEVWKGERSDHDNLTFCLWSNKTASVLKGDKIANNASIDIPSTIEHKGVNYDVIKIKEGAFLNSTKLRVLNFKEDSKIQIIEPNAFKGCTKLEKVYIGNCRELVTIDEQAFYGCTKLDYISFINCENLEVIGEKTFYGCESLLSLDFGNISKLRSIGVRAFENCLGLTGKSVTIPNSVINIWNYAFYSNHATNPNYGKLIHKKVAHLTGSLPNLNVEPVSLPEEAKQYESVVDSSKDKTTLHKAAKWTDEKRTKAEIRIDYGFDFDRTANMDVVFVMDQSGSMHNSAIANDKNGVPHRYPRLFLMDDIVHGASQMLLDNKEGTGYNNRVSLVAFGKNSTPIYKSSFMTKSADVKSYLENHPMNHEESETNYDGGLQGAIDVLKNRDPNRKPVVIFLSDGAFSKTFSGETQAETLRKQKIPVYPISMFITGNESKLRPISHDKNTVYVAETTDSFQKIMMDVLNDVINQAHTLSVQLEDVITKEFELESGSEADFEVSENGGKVTHIGNKAVWDLNGCAQGVNHTLKMQVKLKPGTEYKASGVLPTNDSLKMSDNSVTTKEQPKLDRYLAHHEFQNETFSNKELPEDVRELLPPSKGGFANNTIVKVDGVTSKVRTKEGQWWEFLGWDKTEQTIAGKDVLFVGKWRYVGYDFSFIKQNEEGRGLHDAEFKLYAWKGIGKPADCEMVTEESLTAGKWKLVNTQASQANGRVDFLEVPVQEGNYFQLVETRAPERYRKPQGQWRITFSTENGFIENDQIRGLPSPSGEQPPEFKKIQDGEFKDMWVVTNKPAHGELPATGGRGAAGFAIGAVICWGIAMVVIGGWHLYNHKQK